MAGIVALGGTMLCASVPHWVVDPASAGDDLPSRGRSLFDFLVMQEEAGRQVQAVPFPFSALLQRIASRTVRDARSAVPTAVLVPLGRSLQRTSAAPEFFAFPRAVVAVVAEPSSSRDPYLKDRVYLGYQEKANVIEVISYNEDEGRFEFQVVTDYRPGGTPKVAYANRTLCVACHQNAAPIFSRAVWDETNANPAVAKALDKERKHFYGIPVDRGIDVPNAIDDAKLRANQFAVHQLLWKDGCGGGDAAAVSCRAGLFAAILRYRLTGQSSFERTDASYREKVTAPLLAIARRQWPGGLAIGNPDIPNRNPLPANAAPSSSIAVRDSGEIVNVGAPFDPLLPRPPLEVWRVDNADDIERLVAGLSGFVAESDVEQLDQALLMQAEGGRAVRRTYRARCKTDAVAIDQGRQRVEFRCTAGVPLPDRGVALEGRLLVTGNRVVSGVIDRLDIEGLPPSRDLDLDIRRSDLRSFARVVAATPMRGRLRARGADGSAFERIELRWGGREGAATLFAVDDFASAKKAIDELASADLAGKFDGFDALAFRRARLMPALLNRLGAKPEAWCCVDASGMPTARAARADIPDLPVAESFRSATAASHAAFHRYCAECHRGADRAPPNFLLGDADEVEAKLKHCAPRIFYRLSMWQQSPDARAKTPMPPELALRHFNFSDVSWRDGGALSGLLLSISEKLQTQGGVVGGETLLRQSYENLRRCLPDEPRATLPLPLPQPPDSKQSRHTATLDK
jgi:mono/diheme cytochrome c family protein